MTVSTPEVGGSNPSEASPVLQEVGNVMRDAKMFIDKNNLNSVFGNLAQTEVIEGFIAAQLENEKLTKILGSSRPVRFVRRILTGMTRKEEIHLLYQSLSAISEQNELYIKDPAKYPQAKSIRFAVDTLFESFEAKTGKPIAPNTLIPATILQPWKDTLN